MTRTRGIIAEGLAYLRLEDDESLVESLEAYLDILARWNRIWNLTSVDEPVQMAVNHVLDSLSVASWLRDLEEGSSIVDAGSGAGLPGIPLSIYLAHLKFVLLDSSGKKTRFLTQAKIELGLANVEVEKERAEAYRGQFDVILARAVAPLERIAGMTAHLMKPGGRILAMKGKLPGDELSASLPRGLKIARIEKIAVPFLEADRHIVVME